MKAFLALLMVLGSISASPSATAALLFSNGAFSGPGDYRSNSCQEFAPSGCLTSYTIADDFVLNNDSVVSGFAWHQFELNPQNYLRTRLQILTGIPTDEEFIARFVVFSAVVVAGKSLTPTSSPTLPGYFEAVNSVGGLSVALSAGRYWLAISNDWGPSGGSAWSETLGTSTTSAGRYQWVTNGSTRFYTSENSAFSVLGDISSTQVPEPATLALIAAALLGAATTRRRRQTAANC